MAEEKKNNGLSSNRTHNRNIILLIIFMLSIEGVVLVSALSRTGSKKFLQITDNASNVIYEINGEHLSEFDRYYFENTFGSLEKYGKRLTTREMPFPFRAWITAAAGLPLFLVLISAFAVKAYRTLFVTSEKEVEKTDNEIDEIIPENSFSVYMKIFERMNIFATGFIILLSVFLYWVIPDMMAYVSNAAIDFIVNYKWFFVIVSVFVAGMILWIVYLRYLLAGKVIEAKKEIAIKQIEMNVKTEKTIEIGEKSNLDAKSVPMIDYLTDRPEINHDIPDIWNKG